MAKLSIKSRNRIKLSLSLQELNTLTIALASLDVPTLDDEAIEQGLSADDVDYDLMTLFKTFTDVNDLYPQRELESSGSENT